MPYVRAEDRRAQATEAAVRVITRDGIGAASLRRIASEAGIPLSNLSHVFPTKEDLFAETLKRTADVLRQAVFDVGKNKYGTIEHLVSAVIEMKIAALAGDGDWSSVEWAERAQYELYLWALRTPGRAQLAAEDYLYIIAAMEQVFRAHLAQSGDISIDPETLGQLTAAILDGLILQALSGKLPDSVIRRVPMIAASLVAASRI
ncbi:TetR/AcrR family transcriptional regulator [Mycolicibacterium baixiangningiae]|uniref:TetR/AcrR family transcriptional regulator n=1 Tax=Mycolicibacterium baixiangningiae TaxID=2761578 RepID=UPI001868E45E|nr:TetR family transcriptional regulator [Mycolicibacterium baixiangningiae]